MAWISKNLDNVVFVLWGNYAKKKGSKVDKVCYRQLLPPPLALNQLRLPEQQRFSGGAVSPLRAGRRAPVPALLHQVLGCVASC